MRGHFATMLQGILWVVGCVFDRGRSAARIAAVLSGRLLQHKPEGVQFVMKRRYGPQSSTPTHRRRSVG